ncbi:hypothetical protein LguiA_034803 [Lonicera macranthoides]
MKKRNLHQATHPFDRYAFEAFHHGSWHPVDRLRIKDGAIRMLVKNKEKVTEENIPISHLRIMSRKASLSDCTCILRPGMDVSVFSPSQNTENSDTKNKERVWTDAKISSIERKPHENECSCEFYVSFYVTQGPAGFTKKKIYKEVINVKINQISILQKLERNPCENTHYRWSSAEDCPSRNTFKLFTGKFSTDLSWLVVASVFQQLVFDVRSIQNQIVYQIWDSDDHKGPTNSERQSNGVNFKVENGISIPILVSFIPRENLEAEKDSDLPDDGPMSLYDQMGLRRSKRRNVQPERYLGCDDLPYAEVDLSRIGLYRPQKFEYEEMPMALSIQDDHAYKNDTYVDNGERINYNAKEFHDSFNSWRSKIKPMEKKPVVDDEGDHQSELAIVPLFDRTENNSRVHEKDLNAEIPQDHKVEIGEILSKCVRLNGSLSVHRKKASEVEFLEAESGWEGKGWRNKQRKRRDSRSSSLVRESVYDFRFVAKRSLSASVYREMIRRCMQNIEVSVNKEQPLVIDQWKEFRATNFLDQSDNDVPLKENEDENSETEMLWKEMEFAMASTYILEDEDPAEVENPNKISGPVCRHDYRLNEEIGIVCLICGFVCTEIKDVMPSFLPSTNLITNREPCTEDDPEEKVDEDGGLDLFCIPTASNTPLTENKDNVWALIPELKEKLRFHQKRAFEFLWRNIAGSMIPRHMEQEREKRGGCVISHSPGAGKTLLIITFLVSYLKLFPGSRPLVLAPKTTLYTWYKEIIKWDIPIPVYQIHGGQTYRGEVSRQKAKLGPGVPCNQDVMHVLDCLEKIQKWLAQPSVLLMGYTSFLILTREDSKYAHRQYMGKVLRECPGILILDEGHNPRSTKSRLRKALMKVDTPLRVLLSGTLFQNNFGEYFNTLCLARPRFVNEVLMELDPKYRRRKKGSKTRFSLENRARKLFIYQIAGKIDSSIPKERLQALNTLKNLTSGFIDVHEGGTSDSLPGLQCYTLLMKSTTVQQEILDKLQNQRPLYKGFPLELELLITLGSIHPWLIRTTMSANQYFSPEELESLEGSKFDLKLGSKIRFVMSLVPRCLLRREKVLIFCHNIAPINLFLEIFEMFYGWKKGEEVLVLQGDLELFERGRVMDKFEEPGGASKVMLASITACAEGISLTAASRVILLDSEWNPSKSKQAIARAFRPGQDKVVYVYQLLATGTLEEEKYRRTTWKEWVSSLIFSEEHVEDPCHWQAPKIEDELLREIVEEDRATLFHMIMKNEKASNGLVRGKE